MNKTNWKEMTHKEKVYTIVYIIISVIALGFIVADVAELLPHAHSYWLFTFAVLLGLDCAGYWKEKRKTAVICLCAAVVMAILGILNFFI